MPLATIAAIVGIGAGGLSIANSLGGQGGGTQGFNPFTMPYAYPAAYNYQAGTNDLLNQSKSLQTTVDPALLSILNNTLNAGSSPAAGYASAAQTGVPNLMAGDASTLQSLAGMNFQNANTATGAGNQVLNTAFDPQNALYDRTKALTSQDYLAALNLTGNASSPYGAGVFGQGMSDFELNWQNNQLNRQATGASAYGNLLQTGAGEQSLGADQLMQALGYTSQIPSSSLGYYDMLNQYMGTGINNYVSSLTGGPMAAEGAALSGILPYLGLSSSNNPFGAFATNRQFAANQQLGGMMGLMSGLNQLNTASNNPNSWFNGIFGSGNTQYGGGGTNPYNVSPQQFSTYYGGGDSGANISTPAPVVPTYS